MVKAQLQCYVACGFVFVFPLGGSTFCAVAALMMMSRMDSVLTGKTLQKLHRWCISRQQSGFQGRPNKPVDTCYSFWLGATLQVIMSCLGPGPWEIWRWLCLVWGRRLGNCGAAHCEQVASGCKSQLQIPVLLHLCGQFTGSFQEAILAALVVISDAGLV